MLNVSIGIAEGLITISCAITYDRLPGFEWDGSITVFAAASSMVSIKHCIFGAHALHSLFRPPMTQLGAEEVQQETKNSVESGFKWAIAFNE